MLLLNVQKLLNLNQSKWRLAVQLYFPLQSVLSALTKWCETLFGELSPRRQPPSPRRRRRCRRRRSLSRVVCDVNVVIIASAAASTALLKLSLHQRRRRDKFLRRLSV